MTELYEQGTPEWLQQRCGKVTASRFADVLSKGRSGAASLTRAKYLRQVVGEQLTGKPADTFTNGHMERGTIQEPYARMAYEDKTGLDVEETGFILHPDNELIGGSPDGLTGAFKGVEIKSVIPTVQIETILAGVCPPKHLPQIQGLMWITNRASWDFVSFSPDMPAPLNLFICNVERDNGYIETLEAAVNLFIADADDLKSKLIFAYHEKDA